MESKLPEEIQKKVDKVAQTYESATQHEGLGPAIFKDGVMYAMAYAKVEADKAVQSEIQQLKERCDKMEAALEGVMRLKPLWQYLPPVKPEHEEEAFALSQMEAQINEALAHKHEGINEKEGEDE